jgi:hypothetical protein
MNVIVPYETLLSRHPEQVEACIFQVRKGKAKAKDTDPATWEWQYKWATRVHSYSFRQVLAGEAEPEKDAWNELSSLERVNDIVSRSLPVWILCTPPGKRTKGWATLDETFFPIEGRALLSQIHTESMASAGYRCLLMNTKQQLLLLSTVLSLDLPSL